MKNILFIHQNFPGQYRYLAKYFADHSEWNAFAVGEKPCVQAQFHLLPKNMKAFGYDMPEVESAGAGASISSRVRQFSGHATRADALAKVLMRQKNQGLSPDVILVHPGWGEALYLRELFPSAKIIGLFEFFFSATKNNINFDPDLSYTLDEQLHYRMSNTANLISMDVTDVGVSPTQWQLSSFPEIYHDKIKVIHDGVDTTVVKPSHSQSLTLKATSNGDVVLTRDDEIITYSVRNLEPSRGFHRFMRVLPKLQALRPQAIFVVVGGDEKSYSNLHPSGKPWREVMLAEMGDALDLSRVIFTGKIPYASLLTLFSVTSIHLYWTTPFVLSWSLMEAMACEACVLASSTSPVKEVIQDGENGFLFDYFSEDELLEQVDKLMSDPSLRQKIGGRARDFIKKNYDLTTVCLPQHIALIEQTLEQTH